MQKIVLLLALALSTSAANAQLLKFGQKIPFAGKYLDKKDEAMLASNSKEVIEKMKQGSDEDYYMDMDYGLSRPENQDQIHQQLSVFMPGISKADAVKAFVKGRNNWIAWSGGNDRFWDYLSDSTIGSLDFLKLVSNDPQQPYSRSNRWEEIGLVNEPCFEKNTQPMPERWGLLLDKRIVSADCPAEPFSDAKKYPGVKLGARGATLTYKGQPKVLEVGSFYGLPSGVVGLRLFTNPEFDAKAAAKWDANRYYNDPSYYSDPSLVKPYRVGMSCAFCHVGPNPVNQPANFNSPKWANLSSNVGAQYFWFDRVFNFNYKRNVDNFIYQLSHTARPGALDTSLVSSDQINNPRTMNAVYELAARMHAAAKFGNWEKLLGDENLNAQFSKLAFVPKSSPLRTFTSSDSSMVLSPRVLKDGSDSVGVLGALNRVYVNIGLFSEHWLENFTPVIGGSSITPFQIKKAEANSGYWQANVQQTPDLALFFLVATRKDSLALAPNGTKYLKDIESEQVTLGKKLFANNCAACHSSKLPEKAYSIFNRPECVGAGYLKCWNQYVELTKTTEFHTEMEKIVLAKDFLKDNFLTTDVRVPMTAVDTNLCSSIATNAIKDNIWDNFASSSYKALPTVGTFRVNYPLTLKSGSSNLVELTAEEIEVPAGGRGYLRPPSLVSIWATAPFFQNNSLGKFDLRGTVEGRLASFEDSIKRLLNPDLRGEVLRPGEVPVQYTSVYGDKIPGVMDVTTADSYLKIPIKFVPFLLKTAVFKSIIANGGKFEKQGDEFVITYTKEALEKPVIAANEVFKKDKRKVAQYDAPMDEAITQEQNAGTVLKLGPIPAGTPVNLIANIDLTYAGAKLDVLFAPKTVLQAQYQLIDAVTSLTRATFEIKFKGLKGNEARDRFMELAGKDLIQTSKCTDMTVNRGHYFGTKYSRTKVGFTPAEQTALTEYLKHF
ncbi:hypothetical protein CIK05_03815 [Bdellovibrio sp. qaytius]|nr:hypothetical protein CIK05_03815 [Bdellovibrio sp. qaytius]